MKSPAVIYAYKNLQQSHDKQSTAKGNGPIEIEVNNTLSESGSNQVAQSQLSGRHLLGWLVSVVRFTTGLVSPAPRTTDLR